MNYRDHLQTGLQELNNGIHTTEQAIPSLGYQNSLDEIRLDIILRELQKLVDDLTILANKHNEDAV